MKDPRLRELNFHDLLHYPDAPLASFRYPQPIRCHGYCVTCEDAGLLDRTGKRLDLMSHGCDTSDFEAVLGPMPSAPAVVEQPILFLLEKPGADYCNGEPVPFRTFNKQPPTKHYYWTPKRRPVWPSRIEEFEGNFYGPYFAYLMLKHRLHNVYITNLVKCRWSTDRDGELGQVDNWNPQAIIGRCAERYLSREIRIFGPQIAFCFGRKAEVGLRKRLGCTDCSCRITYLYHPSAIELARRIRKTQYEMVVRNDEWITQETNRLT